MSLARRARSHDKENIAVDGLISFLRSHPAARRGLSVISALLLIGAVALLGYPLYSNLQHDRLQGRLGDRRAPHHVRQALRQHRPAEAG